MANNLEASRWAPKSARNATITTTTSTARPSFTPSSSRADSLETIRRLIERLKWKASLLYVSRANVDTLPEGQRMFKLDFWEYFVVLEKTLVLFLSFYRISLGDYSTPKQQSSLIGGPAKTFLQHQMQQNRAISNHRYHAVVLESFERTDNPLRRILGEGEIVKHLKDAKELRNRWKDVEAEHAVEVSPLPSLAALESMLTAIAEALPAALETSTAHLRIHGEDGSRSKWQSHQVLLLGTDEDGDIIMEDVPYEGVSDPSMWD